jgi:hypothetical protein
VRISSDLVVTEEPKPTVREFADFEDYRSFLEKNVVAIHTNANNKNRKIRYSPIATISAGYDSPAASVFAKRIGCDQALTYRDARPGAAADTTDSGAHIALILGMNVTTLERMHYLSMNNYSEAECNGPSEFLSLGSRLEGRILFTGFNGGAIWDRNNKSVGPSIIRKDTSGAGLTEFRLRVGFIHLPIPFLGCTSHASIHRISTSDEMRPWVLGNKYDRPIARRLVEEAGVDRTMFGMEKRAACIAPRKEGMRDVMTSQSRVDFENFCQQNWNLRMAATSYACGMVRRLYARHKIFNTRITRFTGRVFQKHIKLPILIPRRWQIIAAAKTDRYSLLFNWSLTKILPRYKVNLANSDSRCSDDSPVVKKTMRIVERYRNV